MQLFTSVLQVRNDLHPVIIQALNVVKRDELFSRMGPWRCEDAAVIGNLYLLQHLRNKEYPWNEDTFGAAISGHLEILKYLHENGCPWDVLTPIGAAENGYLEVLKYLHENGCPWELRTCGYTAKNNYGCPWDKDTCGYSINLNGNLEILKYAHESGCPCD